jgi:predicted dithiol-disulfide oxidoreductase (DUF899 family)
MMNTGIRFGLTIRNRIKIEIMAAFLHRGWDKGCPTCQLAKKRFNHKNHKVNEEDWDLPQKNTKIKRRTGEELPRKGARGAKKNLIHAAPLLSSIRRGFFQKMGVRKMTREKREYPTEKT